ncbi:hypothetical protein K8I61_03780 [bacterium]|nr:hypothetical protein [bacterium]
MYFTEKPIQNWTRVSSDILGTVFPYVDCSVSVDALCAKLHEILQASGKWDGEAWGLVVTNADARAMELRCLMSAPDASIAWDLRYEVREKMIAHINATWPDALPKVRAEITGAGVETADDEPHEPPFERTTQG